MGGYNMKKNKQGTYEDPGIISDPNGSYTGKPEYRNEVPVQDADDL